MKIMTFRDFLSIVLALVAIYGVLMLLGEPTEGGFFDSPGGILVEKMLALGIIIGSIFGIKRLNQ